MEIQLSYYGQVLTGMGFKGMLLRDLLKIIVDNDTLQDFYNFILLEEEEGVTKVLLVHNFIQHMNNKNSYKDYEDFKSAYDEAVTFHNKGYVIERMIAGKVDATKLNKVVTLFDTKRQQIDFELFYERLIRYRSQYSTHEIITLLEGLPTL
ncbi:hypothetical protein BSK59_15760 [Paenibacillus odorifer]|uniref:hypothetical protein n=1 Tax=Paenibacillus odorifer TaxID=189426 RepID=UPI00096F6C3A|nr:hypothetical protein [Paenibacillus odorifer]OME54036.1 hypothetical protein BSK59_15760 [Paenibacillus odorifer]